VKKDDCIADRGIASVNGSKVECVTVIVRMGKRKHEKIF